MRVIGPILLALIIASNIVCSRPQPKSADQWQPVQSIPGALRRNLVGDSSHPGPFKYQLEVPAGSHAAVHRHSKEVHVKVLSGSIFIIIGEPIETSRGQRFTAGNVFVVPAQAWHEEWWEEKTVMEAEGVGPMETVYKSQ